MNGEHVQQGTSAERSHSLGVRKLSKAFKKIHCEGYKPPKAQILTCTEADGEEGVTKMQAYLLDVLPQGMNL